jgi:hypothetical protein
MGETRNAYKIVIDKHERRRYLGRNRHINGRIILKICVKQIGSKDKDCNQRSYDGFQ